MSPAILDQMEQQIPHLRRYARALTRDPDAADDLVQDALERAISRLDRFREGTDLRSWMFTIMHNLYVDHCRRRQRRGVQVPLEEWTPRAHQAASQPDAVALGDLSDNLERLRASERDVIRLVGLEGMKYEDVARSLGVKVGTVKSRLFRARESLRRMQEGAGTG